MAFRNRIEIWKKKTKSFQSELKLVEFRVSEETKVKQSKSISRHQVSEIKSKTSKKVKSVTTRKTEKLKYWSGKAQSKNHKQSCWQTDKGRKSKSISSGIRFNNHQTFFTVRVFLLFISQRNILGICKSKTESSSPSDWKCVCFCVCVRVKFRAFVCPANSDRTKHAMTIKYWLCCKYFKLTPSQSSSTSSAPSTQPSFIAMSSNSGANGATANATVTAANAAAAAAAAASAAAATSGPSTVIHHFVRSFVLCVCYEIHHVFHFPSVCWLCSALVWMCGCVSVSCLVAIHTHHPSIYPCFWVCAAKLRSC